MNWNDYEAIWKRQPLPKGASAELGELRDTFEAKSRKLAATLRVRDILEAGAGVVVAVAYGVHWSFLGAKGWPMGFAMALILGVTGFFVRERWRAHRRRVGPDATLREKVESDLVELRHQARLLRTVWAWYLLPCGLAMAIHFSVILGQIPAWSPVHEPKFIVGCSAFFLLVLGVVWKMNDWAVKRQIQPRIEELEKLHAEMLVVT